MNTMKTNYENLANAIVAQAAEDYQKALCRKHTLEGALKRAEIEIQELEVFFKGDAYKLYTSINPDDLMEALKNEVIECRYDYDKVKKEHSGRKE